MKRIAYYGANIVQIAGTCVCLKVIELCSKKHSLKQYKLTLQATQ